MDLGYHSPDFAVSHLHEWIACDTPLLLLKTGAVCLDRHFEVDLKSIVSIRDSDPAVDAERSDLSSALDTT